MQLDITAYVPVQVIVAGKAFTYKFLVPVSSEGGTVPLGLAIRQPVVVDFGSKGLCVGIVESVNQVPIDPNAKFKYKWIVAAIDRSKYDAILAAESDAGAVIAGGGAPSMAAMLASTAK